MYLCKKDFFVMKIEKWKILDSQYIIKRPWLTARRDTVLLPNGVINDEYYILEYPTWVNVIAITADGKFIMVEQYRHGLQEVFTELVAGVAEKGETPLEAAKRELLEETGYGNGKWKQFSALSQNPGSANNTTYTFLATGVEKITGQSLDKTEDLSIKFLSECEVMEMLIREDLKQAMMVAPLWKYFAQKLIAQK